MDGHEYGGYWVKITSVAFKVDAWTNRERKSLRISSGTVFVHFCELLTVQGWSLSTSANLQRWAT